MVEFTQNGPVGIIQLDRAPANAIDEATLRSLIEIRDRISSDTSVRAVVVQGSPRIFCAGVDIKMVRGFLASDDGKQTMLAFVKRLQQFFRDWRHLPVPTIASLVGSATGGGLELALSCDLRVASSDAMFGLPEVKLGLIPGAGGTQLLSRIAGLATATRLILTGALVSGSEAERLGIVQTVAPAHQVNGIALEWAEQLAAQSPLAVRAAKECLLLAPSPDGYSAEIDATDRLLEQGDGTDRVAAFLSRP